MDYREISFCVESLAVGVFLCEKILWDLVMLWFGLFLVLLGVEKHAKIKNESMENILNVLDFKLKPSFKK